MDEVIDFYEKNGGINLPTPAVEALCEAAAAGSLFRVDLKTRVSAKDAHLVALSGLFRIADGKDGTAVYELAGMALDGPRVGGCGPCTLQDLLLWVRVCSFAFESARTKACVIASVVDANHASKAAMARAGLVSFAAPRWLKTAHRSWQTDPTRTVSDYVMPPIQVANYAGNLKAFLARPKLSRTHKTSGRAETHTVHLDFDWTDDEFLESLTEAKAVDWTDKVPKTQVIALGDDEFELG